MGELLNTDGKLKFYGNPEKRLGLLHIVTGDGKGKTTSSIGLTVRAVGAGYKVLFVQFFKMNSSELKPLEELGVTIKQFQFLGPFFKKYTEEEFVEMQGEFQMFWDEIKPTFEEYDMVVLDEIVYIITKGVFPEKTFLKFLENRSENTELILTGRDFPESIIEKGDYVSEVRLVQHPFKKGIDARKGVEF